MDLFHLNLEDLQKATPCTNCGSSKTLLIKLNQVAVKSVRYSLFECLDCGYWFSPKEDGEVVDYTGYEDILTPCLDNSNVDRYISKIKDIDFSGVDSVLEIGCARGEFLTSLKGMYPNLHIGGLEINEPMCNEAQKNGIDCFIDPEKHVKKYDVIVANHVIEHFHHPKEFLNLCDSLASDSHSLILNFPNKNNVWTKRGFFPDLHLPFHRFYYSVEEVSKILEDSGYIIKSSYSTESKRYIENSKQCRYNSFRGDLKLFKSVVDNFSSFDLKINQEEVVQIEKKIDQLNLGSEAFIYATKLIKD